MAFNDVVIVAEFLVGVSNEVIEVQEVQELAADTVMVEERVVEVEEEEEEEELMKSLECISLQDHDYTLATEATEVGECKWKHSRQIQTFLISKIARQFYVTFG